MAKTTLFRLPPVSQDELAAILSGLHREGGNGPLGRMMEHQHACALLRERLDADKVPVAPAVKADGPYSPELAEAFRDGARELCNSDLGDKIEVPDMAIVEEGEGGAWVAVRMLVSDGDRARMLGEEDAGNVTEAAGVARWKSDGIIWSNIPWTHADQDEALQEGWRLYQGDDGKLEIQCNPIGGPGPVPFNGDDDEAAEHVADVAAGTEEASPVYVEICKRALTLLGRDPMNPEIAAGGAR